MGFFHMAFQSLRIMQFGPTRVASGLIFFVFAFEQAHILLKIRALYENYVAVIATVAALQAVAMSSSIHHGSLFWITSLPSAGALLSVLFPAEAAIARVLSAVAHYDIQDRLIRIVLGDMRP